MSDSHKTIAIAAMAANRVIGKDGDLPWRLSGDLKFFKRTTMGQAILMGRKTWDSIGKPLPGRRNIVLSRTLDVAPEGAELIRHLDEVANLKLKTDLFVIGGAEVYRLFLDRCDEILLTYVFDSYEGDTYLPEFESDFKLDGILETESEYEIRRYLSLRKAISDNVQR